MHHEINDSRAKWVDKLTDKSPTIKCKIIHWKMRKSGKADKGGWILATASLKVQNLPRRRHFLTQSTEVDEQNSLISWKITSRHDFEEFHNRESDGGEAWGSWPRVWFRRIEGAAAEPDFFRAPVLCLASSLAPPSSDGHGQHWPLDEAFILTKRQEREREGLQLKGDIGHGSHAGVGTMAHVALESTTHPVESMCVSTRGRRKRDVGESESSPRGSVGQTQRIRARALPTTPPRYEPIHIRGRFTTGSGWDSSSLPSQRFKIVEVSYL